MHACLHTHSFLPFYTYIHKYIKYTPPLHHRLVCCFLVLGHKIIKQIYAHTHLSCTGTLFAVYCRRVAWTSSRICSWISRNSLMCVDLCVCKYVRVHVCVCVYVRTYTHMHTWPHMFLDLKGQPDVCVFVCV